MFVFDLRGDGRQGSELGQRSQSVPQRYNVGMTADGSTCSGSGVFAPSLYCLLLVGMLVIAKVCDIGCSVCSAY